MGISRLDSSSSEWLCFLVTAGQNLLDRIASCDRTWDEVVFEMSNGVLTL